MLLYFQSRVVAVIMLVALLFLVLWAATMVILVTIRPSVLTEQVLQMATMVLGWRELLHSLARPLQVFFKCNDNFQVVKLLPRSGFGRGGEGEEEMGEMRGKKNCSDWKPEHQSEC